MGGGATGPVRNLFDLLFAVMLCGVAEPTPKPRRRSGGQMSLAAFLPDIDRIKAQRELRNSQAEKTMKTERELAGGKARVMRLYPVSGSAARSFTPGLKKSSQGAKPKRPRQNGSTCKVQSQNGDIGSYLKIPREVGQCVKDITLEVSDWILSLGVGPCTNL